MTTSRTSTTNASFASYSQVMVGKTNSSTGILVVLAENSLNVPLKKGTRSAPIKLDQSAAYARLEVNSTDLSTIDFYIHEIQTKINLLKAQATKASPSKPDDLIAQLDSLQARAIKLTEERNTLHDQINNIIQERKETFPALLASLYEQYQAGKLSAEELKQKIVQLDKSQEPLIKKIEGLTTQKSKLQEALFLLFEETKRRVAPTQGAALQPNPSLGG